MDSPAKIFLEELRGETAALHQALERNALSSQLMSPAVTLAGYTAYLQRMYGFVAAFEQNIFPVLEGVFPGLDALRKSPLLEADLCALGTSPGGIYPEGEMRSAYPSIAKALGALYVLEGSTLGGMVIHKYLQQVLGNAITGRAAYFTAYGAQTGPRWKAFLQAFCALSVGSGEGQQVIAGAADTFRRIDQWFSTSHSS